MVKLDELVHRVERGHTYFIFHITHFSMTILANMLRVAGFQVQEERQVSPALWFAHSIIERLFAKPGRTTRELRDPVLILFLMFFVRSLFFPLLWAGNILGQGDCLVVVAKKI